MKKENHVTFIINLKKTQIGSRNHFHPFDSFVTHAFDRAFLNLKLFEIN